ncbi:TRAP transporter substrate-binding protein [Pseudalkalibacillus sp. JSM 102089]|uniref:TRAP transporter substrate-binding protein n=1 Tax=Pseudalkalibacillus sp. JSM 102089 TaxID=3229856 RepID=UPI003524C0B7
MNKILKWLTLTMLLSIGVLVTGCSADNTGGNASAGEGAKTINVSLPLGPESHHDAGVQKFKEELEKNTDGSLTVVPHYNNELGGEREVVEGMGIGTIDAGISSTGPIGGFVQEVMMWDMPYLVDEAEQAYAILDGDIGDELAEKIEKQANVVVLGWMENGFRNETNSVRPVETPEDLKGIKHRTQESKVQIDTWEAFGTNATPMAWPEVYTALQQKVMESQENPLATILDVRFYEVQDYLNLTKHVYSPAPLLMSKQLFNSFTDEEQEAIMQAAEVATKHQRKASQDMEEDVKKQLEEKGMTVTEPNLEKFKKAVEPVYEKWAPEIGEELIKKARNTEY